MNKIGWQFLGLLVGGNSNNGSNAGLVYGNSNNAPSNSDSNIGSRLCFIKIYIRIATLPLGRK